MTTLTVNGSAAAATTLATAGKLFNATGGTSGNTSTKVGTGTQFKQIFALGTTTNQTGVASIPAPIDSNFNGWMWDVTTLEGQRLAAGTWTPTLHLLASTSTTVTPTVAWYKRSSGGVYTSIGSVAGSSIALTTSSQSLTFTPPSLALMDFATGDKLVMWLWVNQTAGGATNSTISVVEATSGSIAGVAGEAQAATPGYTPTPVSLASTTLTGVGTLSGTLSTALAFTETLSGIGTLAGTLALGTLLSGECDGIGILSLPPAYVLRAFGSTLVTTGALALTTALSPTLAGVGIFAASLSASLAFSPATLSGSGTLAGTFALTTALSPVLTGVGTLTGTEQLATALSPTLAGVGTLDGTIALTTILTTTLAGGGILVGTGSFGTFLANSLVGSGTLVGTLATSTNVALVVTLAGTSTLAGTPTLTTSLPPTSMLGSGTLAGTLALTTSFASILVGDSTLIGTPQLQIALTMSMVGTGFLASTLFLETQLVSTLVGSGTFTTTTALSMQVALSLLCSGIGTSTALMSALGTVVLSSHPIGSLPPASYVGKTVVPARPSGVYMVNGVPLDSQPIVCTAPLESGSGLRFLVGSTFFLLFDRPTSLTQTLLPDGGVVSMTFALANGNMVTVPQVQVASTLVVGVSIATFAVTCTLLSSLAVPTFSLASSN